MKTLLMISSLFLGMNSFAQAVNYSCELRYTENKLQSDGTSTALSDQITFLLSFSDATSNDVVQPNRVALPNTQTTFTGMLFPLPNQPGWMRAGLILLDSSGVSIGVGGNIQVGQPIFLSSSNKSNLFMVECKVQ